LSFQIITPLAIVTVAFVLFVGGWLRVDVVGLLVLSALALTGLVTPQEALAGFSSPAVVTVWAMFILSAGLTRTGIAHRLGQPLQRFTKRSEALLMEALMVAASLLSALSTASTIGISAHLLMMTVAIAASASFASPLSHPAHLLVMDQGGYRFTDYLKVGVPLTLVVILVSVWLLPVLWPP
jgi:di/tricarboxylate transporter